jgi:hypothetical protein
MCKTFVFNSHMLFLRIYVSVCQLLKYDKNLLLFQIFLSCTTTSIRTVLWHAEYIRCNMHANFPDYWHLSTLLARFGTLLKYNGRVSIVESLFFICRISKPASVVWYLQSDRHKYNRTYCFLQKSALVCSKLALKHPCCTPKIQYSAQHSFQHGRESGWCFNQFLYFKRLIPEPTAQSTFSSKLLLAKWVYPVSPADSRQSFKTLSTL